MNVQNLKNYKFYINFLFFSVLKRLDLKDDSDNECESKSDKTSSSITEEKSEENLANLDAENMATSKNKDKKNLSPADDAMKLEGI